MQARNFIGSALLVAGMVLAGCGGTQAEPTEQDHLSTSEDALPNCTGQNYEITYYSDASKTTEVGVRGCDCSNYYRWGVTSAFSDSWSGTCF